MIVNDRNEPIAINLCIALIMFVYEELGRGGKNQLYTCSYGISNTSCLPDFRGRDMRDIFLFDGLWRLVGHHVVPQIRVSDPCLRLGEDIGIHTLWLLASYS